jgi:glycosyltransferase involved in cell wall biosynthesis
MRIGIDMFAAQTADLGSASGHFARRLVRLLTTRFPAHDYFLHYHEGIGREQDDWPERIRTRRVTVGAGAAGRTNGQLALEQCSDAVDVWLATATLEQVDEYLPPCAPLDGPRLAGLVCDLGPATAPDRYLRLPATAHRHRWAFDTLRRYDLLLTVSETTRDDCRRAMNLAGERVAAIGAAGDAECFFPDRAHLESAPSKAVLQSLGIRQPFVLCRISDDENRSMVVLMTAIDRVDSAVRDRFQFVIVGKLHAEHAAGWRGYLGRQGLNERVLLTKVEHDQTARLLYQRCQLFVDASPQEGSGLAVVHALQCGAAAIVGRGSPAASLVANAAVQVDMDQPAELAARLGGLLSDHELLGALREAAPNVADVLSEESVAQHAMAAIERWAPRPIAVGGNRLRTRARTPLAFFSPLLPQRSGIADYSERLLARLKRHHRIDLYHDAGYLPHLGLSSAEFACRDYRLFNRFQRAVDYAGVIYQMANTHYCEFVYETLLRHPGVVVLHDFLLPEFHLGYARRPGVVHDFIANEIDFESDKAGREYRASPEVWSGEPGGLCQACIRRGLTFNRRILERAAMAVVHDRWGAEQIGRISPALAERVRVIPHGASVYDVGPERKRALRRQFGFDDETLILSSFGILNGAKYHSETIEALAAIAAERPSARLLFVGGDSNHGQEKAKVDALGLTDRVRFFGHAPMETFLELMSITDVGINLRQPPTRGETSGALLTLLSAGVPTIVTDVDAFSSYPDTVVRKIKPLEQGDRALEFALRGLLEHPDARIRLGRSAVSHVRDFHDWTRVAALYAEAVEEARRIVRDSSPYAPLQPEASTTHHSPLISHLSAPWHSQFQSHTAATS